MRQFFSLAAAALVLAASAACSSSSTVPLKAPPRPADVESRATPHPREREPHPPLVAPPPAYGNKIVMARAATPPGSSRH